MHHLLWQPFSPLVRQPVDRSHKLTVLMILLNKKITKKIQYNRAQKNIRHWIQFDKTTSYKCITDGGEYNKILLWLLFPSTHTAILYHHVSRGNNFKCCQEQLSDSQQYTNHDNLLQSFGACLKTFIMQDGTWHKAFFPTYYQGVWLATTLTRLKIKQLHSFQLSEILGQIWNKGSL